jgi:hypothetical protein
LGPGKVSEVLVFARESGGIGEYLLGQGAVYKQAFVTTELPSKVETGPFFHFQEWKQRFRKNQIAGKDLPAMARPCWKSQKTTVTRGRFPPMQKTLQRKKGDWGGDGHFTDHGLYDEDSDGTPEPSTTEFRAESVGLESVELDEEEKFEECLRDFCSPQLVVSPISKPSGSHDPDAEGVARWKQVQARWKHSEMTRAITSFPTSVSAKPELSSFPTITSSKFTFLEEKKCRHGTIGQSVRLLKQQL